MSVSYTHLDVYKRQSLRSGNKMLTLSVKLCLLTKTKSFVVQGCFFFTIMVGIRPWGSVVSRLARARLTVNEINSVYSIVLFVPVTVSVWLSLPNLFSVTFAFIYKAPSRSVVRSAFPFIS